MLNTCLRVFSFFGLIGHGWCDPGHARVRGKNTLFVSFPTSADSPFQTTSIRHTHPQIHADRPPVCSTVCTWTMWGPLGPVWGDPAADTTPLCGVRLIPSCLWERRLLTAPSPLPPNTVVLLLKETRHDVPRPSWYPHRLVQGLEWVWTDGGTVVPPEEGVPHPGSLPTHLPWTLAGRLYRDPHPWSWG